MSEVAALAHEPGDDLLAQTPESSTAASHTQLIGGFNDAAMRSHGSERESPVKVRDRYVVR